MSTENIVQHKKRKRSAVMFDFSKLYFPSQPKESFRVRLSTCAEGITIWVESVKTKQQWQATVKNISDCGPSSIPDDVVYTLLEKALGLLQSSARSSDDPEVDLTNSDKGVLLSLQLVLGGVWRPEFVFTLLPVALERVDLLEARLRDAYDDIELLRAGLRAAHDEIKVLRTGSAPSCLSISSKTACKQNKMVCWNGDGPLISASHYKLSGDCQQIAILKEGAYQVNVRLAGTNRGNGQSMGLQLNGADFAICIQSDANSYQNTAQIHEVVKLKVNDVLQVRCGCDSNSLSNQAANRFTMLFLGN